MKKNALEFWVGLFVLLGAAAIGFLAFRAAGGQSFGKSSQTYTVYADFSDIGGLKTNAPGQIRRRTGGPRCIHSARP